MAKISFYEIASVLVEHNGLTHGKATDFVKVIFDIIQERLPVDQQVKIKGLGTFKIIEVEDRESINVNTGERILIEGHSKITFTPDAAMKDLINKPFSQFETVILKDGIAFEEPAAAKEAKPQEALAVAGEDLGIVMDAIAEPVAPVDDDFVPAAEEFISAAGEFGHLVGEVPFVEEYVPVVEEVAAAEVEEIKVEEEVAVTVEEPVIPPVVEEETPAVDEEEISAVDEEAGSAVEEDKVIDFIPSREVDPAPEPVAEIAAAKAYVTENIQFTVEEQDEDELETPSRVKSVLLHILYVVVIAALSAYGGYWYGVNSGSKANAKQDTTEKAAVPEAKKVVKEAIPTDTLRKDTLKKPAVAAAQPAANDETAVLAHREYAAMDARVRTGAYIIVGEDRTVTARKGETLYQLSRRALGEGMECYIEVFNGISAKTELQEGQKIKIPKLQLKKKKQTQDLP